MGYRAWGFRALGLQEVNCAEQDWGFPLRTHDAEHVGS